MVTALAREGALQKSRELRELVRVEVMAGSKKGVEENKRQSKRGQWADAVTHLPSQEPALSGVFNARMDLWTPGCATVCIHCSVPGAVLPLLMLDASTWLSVISLRT